LLGDSGVPGNYSCLDSLVVLLFYTVLPLYSAPKIQSNKAKAPSSRENKTATNEVQVDMRLETAHQRG